MKRFRMISISGLLALVFSAMPLSARAMTMPCSPSPITLNSITNDVATTITITGSGFLVGSAVVLLDGSALPTIVINDTVITAEVPAGKPARKYNVTIANGVDTDVTCVKALQIKEPTPPPATVFARPQVVVNMTAVKGAAETKGEFNVRVHLENAGGAAAYGVQAIFTSPELAPLENGGVKALDEIGVGNHASLAQGFRLTEQVYGQKVVVVDLTVTYYDSAGTAYSDKFTLPVVVSGGVYSGVAVATSTPTGVKSSQLVISGYSTDIDPLQPGEKFALKLTIQNVGNAKAQRITMIVGGGSSGSSGETPQPGGVSGGGGDFANFAPVGASNVQSLGELDSGDRIEASQNLVVNVSTNPGAYPMRITFSYLNDKNEVINDEQVITLLVYSLPNVDVSFYQPAGEFFIAQPGILPIQIANVGKRLVVLGNVKIESDNGLVESGAGLVGSLDVGGFFTIDPLFTPDQPGTTEINVVVDYLDDFNQPRTFTKTLNVNVTDQIIEETPEAPGGLEEPVTETFWQKVKRFIFGILGLDSAPPSDVEPAPMEGSGSFEEVAPVAPGGKNGP